MGFPKTTATISDTTRQADSGNTPTGNKDIRKTNSLMRIIESRLTGKQSQETCEDGIVITENFIAVIDGSTSKTPLRISKDMQNGRYAMLLISQYIRQMPPQISLTNFCSGITAVFHDIYMQSGLDIKRLEAVPQERITASAVIYSDYHKEIWMIGDCQCMVDGILYENTKPYETRLAARRARIIKNTPCKKRFRTHDTAREAIIPDMLRAMQDQNKTYAVIDGFSIPQEKIKVIPADAGSMEIVLASDGYPFLHPTLSESEEHLKAQIANDPLNIDTFKATKGITDGNLSFDDRAYIRFTV